MIFAYNLDPDEQNRGPHLRSKLFDTQIIIIGKKLKRKKWKKENSEKCFDIIELIKRLSAAEHTNQG